VALPEEDVDHGACLCGKLLVHMHGTGRVADGRHNERPDAMESIGFVRGVTSACAFYHLERMLISSVHGDDFPISGWKRSLDWFRSELEKHH